MDMSKPGCMVIGALTMLEAVVTISGACARGSTGTAGGLLYSGGMRLATGTGVSVTVGATGGATVALVFVLIAGSVTESFFTGTVDSAPVTRKPCNQYTQLQHCKSDTNSFFNTPVSQCHWVMTTTSFKGTAVL
jgi:hypothetical protein